MFFRALYLLALYPVAVLCLLESEAGVLDWKRSHIGIPRFESSATAPIFHRVGSSGSSQVIIVTATKSNLLAASNPKDGNTVWRRSFEPNDHLVTYQTYKDGCVSLSGPGGTTVRLYEVLNGNLLWETSAGRSDSTHLGADIAFDHSADIFVLTSGRDVRRLEGFNGRAVWTWSQSDSPITFSNLIATQSALFVIGGPTPTSSNFHITILNPNDGSLGDTYKIPCRMQGAQFQVLSSVTANSPAIAWLEDDVIKYITLDFSSRPSTKTVAGANFKEIVDVGLQRSGHFVALTADGSSHVIRLGPKSTGIQDIWEFADSARSSHQSSSIFAGGVDKAGNPYVARIYWSHALRQASIHVFSSHGGDGRGMVNGLMFPFDTASHGVIVHATLDVVNPREYVVMARALITTSTGSVQLWQQEELQWINEESLAEIQAIDFIDIPEQRVVEGHVNERLLARIYRHIAAMKNILSLLALVNDPWKLLSEAASAVESSPMIKSETFGSRKLIIAATSTGKIFGIDSHQGRIIWGRILGISQSPDSSIQPRKIFVLKTMDSGVFLLAEQKLPSGNVETVVFRIYAANGSIAGGGLKAEVHQSGAKIFDGPLRDSFLLSQSSSVECIVAISDDLKAYPIVPTLSEIEGFTDHTSALQFFLSTSPHRLTGYQINPKVHRGALGRPYYETYQTWTLSFPNSESISDIIKSTPNPIAAFGKGVRDRKTLYKYLNPNIVAVVTSSAPQRNFVVYLIDAAKGTILYSSPVPAAGVRPEDIHVTLADNWLVYHYFDRDGVGGRGWRIVSVDFFEGDNEDDSTRSHEIPSMSSDALRLHQYERSFIFPYGVHSITTTRTKFGISSRDLIVSTTNNQLYSVPRRYLDPRRPNGKAVPEEYLIPYDPVIPDDSRRVLSHNHQLIGKHHVITTPSHLESTSIVLSYGVDIFLTRVSPSGTFDVLNSNFNKFQLIAIIVALSLGIVATRPMVLRKMLRESWYP